ncbi:Multiple epidermal growth factor-like domains protein 8 [Halotydeus destructor]|nr:Multiple epidermal growth factor-like domains protein 8 [Halotydeus destructor]
MPSASGGQQVKRLHLLSLLGHLVVLCNEIQVASGQLDDRATTISTVSKAPGTLMACHEGAENGTCECEQGYTNDGGQCRPHCSKGCVHGKCSSPNNCQCNFGFVGLDCSFDCKCNGHSSCPSPNRVTECLECKNNTQGSECDRCKPFYVGNPVNGGKCVPCMLFCNGHSDICVAPEFINDTHSAIVFEQVTTIKELGGLVQEGSLADAVCLNCLHNTDGVRCESCLPGFFKKGDSLFDVCHACHCNGHGDSCDPVSGESCNCANNTETDRQCTGKPHKTMLTPCWQLQCSKCKEYFLGLPTNGHQCYRHMFLDKEYCLDPDTQEECHRNPSPLTNGRTVFFAVQPRYMNVNIRIVIDIALGEADFYLSAREDAFVVTMNKTDSSHLIWLDDKFNLERDNEDMSSQGAILVNRLDRLLNETNPYGIMSSFDLGPNLKIKQHTMGREMITYLSIRDAQDLLIVKNVRNRLVITIPQEVHDLRSTRFYMILKGKDEDGTYGNLFFRQDQSRIDLFVFFSVFFSCFFLFLASCVIIWKVKQAFDMRRARRLHVAEMKHMASRPFASVLVRMSPVTEHSDDYEFALSSPAHHVQGKKSKLKIRGSHSSLRDSPKHNLSASKLERYLIKPVAVEPTQDGLAAVLTTVIVLPGGSSAPIRMSLASSLVTIKGSQQQLTAHHSHQANNNSSRAAFHHSLHRRRPRY